MKRIFFLCCNIKGLLTPTQNETLFVAGDFIQIEDKPPDNKKGRLVREGDDDMDEDEERVDMSAINGAKEREERREKFYSVQQECMWLIFMIQIEGCI